LQHLNIANDGLGQQNTAADEVISLNI